MQSCACQAGNTRPTHKRQSLTQEQELTHDSNTGCALLQLHAMHCAPAASASGLHDCSTHDAHKHPPMNIRTSSRPLFTGGAPAVPCITGRKGRTVHAKRKRTTTLNNTQGKTEPHPQHKYNASLSPGTGSAMHCCGSYSSESIKCQ
jgi:hypothetical protein